MRVRGLFVGGIALFGLGAAALAQDAEADLPRNAQPGMCYARVMIPAQYTTGSERVLKKEASSRIEVVPAKYEWATERVLVKEASSTLEVVPAQYEWTEEKVLVKPAQTVWKKGRGPIERVDNGTGEIMCLVEEPAVYKTVRKRVLKSSARTVSKEVPAEYETVKVRRLVNPPSERMVEIPAEYETVSTRKLVKDSELVWRPVLCETNLRSGIVSDLQRALKRAGHDPGPIDGVIGRQTQDAIASFQRAKGLATGGLTMETLRSLDVRVQ